MPKKTFNAVAIIHKLREPDVLIGQGKTVQEVCKALGVTDQTYYRWRKTYSGMRVDQAKRLKELEAENAWLKPAVADLTVEDIEGGRRGKILSLARRRLCVAHTRKKLGCSERLSHGLGVFRGTWSATRLSRERMRMY